MTESGEQSMYTRTDIEKLAEDFESCRKIQSADA